MQTISRKNEKWEELVDFTKIKKGGVPLNKVLTKLRQQKRSLRNI